MIWNIKKVEYIIKYDLILDDDKQYVKFLWFDVTEKIWWGNYVNIVWEIDHFNRRIRLICLLHVAFTWLISSADGSVTAGSQPRPVKYTRDSIISADWDRLTVDSTIIFSRTDFTGCMCGVTGPAQPSQKPGP